MTDKTDALLALADGWEAFANGHGIAVNAAYNACAQQLREALAEQPAASVDVDALVKVWQEAIREWEKTAPWDGMDRQEACRVGMRAVIAAIDSAGGAKGSGIDPGIRYMINDDGTLTPTTPQPDDGDGAVAWAVFDAKHIRFTVYNRELAEAIAERGLLVLPMFGGYEWFDAKADEWKPIDRLPYTWERELGIQWRACTDTRPSAAAAVPEVERMHIERAIRVLRRDYESPLADAVESIYKQMLDAAPAAPKGGVVELPAKWRQDASADHVLPTSLWDQGYAYGRTECADELTAALTTPRAEQGGQEVGNG